jgi:hypothetical protein
MTAVSLGGLAAVRRAGRRTIALACVAAVAATVLFATAASPARAAGGIGGDMGLWGQITNVTPYPWTFVEAGGPSSRWQTGQLPFPNTVQPGQSFVYENMPYNFSSSAFGDAWDYSAWFTYKAQVAGGATEYLTVVDSGCHCTGTDSGQFPDVSTYIYNSSSAPPASYDPINTYFANPPPTNPAPETAQPQIAWSQSDSIYSDAVFFIKGDYTLDASKDPAALPDVLDSLCQNSTNTTCNFDASKAVTWGIGPAVMTGSAYNCVPSAPVPTPADPSKLPPNQESIDYTTDETQSLTVGGSLTGKTETTLFDVMKVDLELTVEASHQWSETKVNNMSEEVDIPTNEYAYIYSAPTVAKTIGTLKLTITTPGGVATFTILNFGATRSGIARDATTPAFDAITTTVPFTPAQYAQCVSGGLGAKAPAPKPKPKRRPKPKAPAPTPTDAHSLFPGTGVGGVKLGATPAQVTQALGSPEFTQRGSNDCSMLDPRCPTGGKTARVWSYPQLEVLFNGRHRVGALLDTGTETSAKGVGVGITRARLQAAYPKVACQQYPVAFDCRLSSSGAQTVFHFPLSGAADTVLVYATADRDRRGRGRSGRR